MEIIELLHMGSGKLLFEVVINDDWKYPGLGLFSSRKKAEEFMKQQEIGQQDDMADNV